VHRTRISPQRDHGRSLYLPLKPNGIGLHIFRNSPCRCSFTNRKIEKDLFAYQDAKRDFYWLGSLNPTLMLWKTYTLKTALPSMRQSSISRTSPQTIILPPELLPRTPSLNTRLMHVSSSNGMKDTKKKKGSSSCSNSGGKEV
jgi:hypothetical protein